MQRLLNQKMNELAILYIFFNNLEGIYYKKHTFFIYYYIFSFYILLYINPLYIF